MKKVLNLFIILALLGPTCCCWAGNVHAGVVDSGGSTCSEEGGGCDGEDPVPEPCNGGNGCSRQILKDQLQPAKSNIQAAKTNYETAPKLFSFTDLPVYEPGEAWITAKPRPRGGARGDPPSLLQLYCVYQV
ncbi:MAG: hypothetical protein ACLFS4_03985 [Opitutales bacterium]